MAREPFKTTVFGIIALGVISSWLANQLGFISLNRLFGTSEEQHEKAHVVQIIDGRPTPTPTKVPKWTPTLPYASGTGTLISQTSQSTNQASPTPAPVAFKPPPPVTPVNSFSSPEAVDLPLQSSSWISWQGLRASVIRVRIYNGLTAVTFKIDGSNNADPYRWVPAPMETAMHDFYTANTNIIDQSGRRYRLVDDNPDVPEQTKYNNGNYVLAPHEIILVTYLFEPLDSSARKLNITFPEVIKDGNFDVGRITIRVALQ